MAIADFFHRDAVAISQILHGFQIDAFTKQLERTRLAIAFGADLTSSRDGRALLDLSVRLAARLYPHVTFVTTLGCDRLADEMISISTSINPNIEVSKKEGAPRVYTGNPTASIAITIGMKAPAIDACTIYAGCNGWLGHVGTQKPYGISDLGNPFGAGFAACLAAANVFRFLFLDEATDTLDEDIEFPLDAATFPKLTEVTLAQALVLVGVGAVGNGAAWALTRAPLIGRIHLIDPQVVDLGNLQRYVLCARSDVGRVKAAIVTQAFVGALKAVPHHDTWAAFVATQGYTWERVLVAVDSARDRRAVQGSLPRWIANAWTQTGDLGVSSHAFLGANACLACLYLPTGRTKSEDQLIAEGLKVPHLQDQVRFLLGSGNGASKELCDAIAAAWDVPTERLGAFVGRPIRELWVEGVCGGGVIPLGKAGSAPGEQQVPLAFQSAFAGLLLAAEAVRDVLRGGTERKTLVRRVDVLRRRLGDPAPRPALKAGTGSCICEDPDFVATYKTKYETGC